MASSKRERELARAKYERQQARRAAEGAAARRRNVVVTAVIAVIVVVVVVGFAVWPRSEDTPAASTPQPTPTPSTSIIGCVAPPETRTEDLSWDAPPATIIKERNYRITFATNCGDIVVSTRTIKAPKTTNSMVFLAEQGYFDATGCHRLTTGTLSVLQCGDPTGQGNGGPGYTVPDENLPKAGTTNYPAGTVAMANAGAGTGGSQFFIVYQDSTLPPDYTIWGQVVSGLDVVRRVAGAGVEGGGSDGAPAQPIVIETATVEPPTSAS